MRTVRHVIAAGAAPDGNQKLGRVREAVQVEDGRHTHRVVGLRRLDCIAIVPRMGARAGTKDTVMASITIRNLDDDVKTRLRVRAADNGRSMEEEARLILRDAVGRRKPLRNLASAIRARIAPLGGVDLELPPREPGREPPSFD